MTDTNDERLGEKISLFCPDCEEERTFVWATWSGDAFYGYPAQREYGWECSICGSRVRVP